MKSLSASQDIFFSPWLTAAADSKNLVWRGLRRCKKVKTPPVDLEDLESCAEREAVYVTVVSNYGWHI